MEQRHLATFAPRGLGLHLTDIAPGAGYELANAGATRLHWIVDGEGMWDDQPYRAATAARSSKAEHSTETAVEATTLLTITIPVLDG